MTVRGRALLTTLVISAVGLLGKVDLHSAEVTEQIVLATPTPIFESAAALEHLTLPIVYDATVTQPDADGALRTRFYARNRK